MIIHLLILILCLALICETIDTAVCHYRRERMQEEYRLHMENSRVVERRYNVKF